MRTKNESDNLENDIVIENEQFKLVIGNNAVAKSLTLKSTNEECLMQEKIWQLSQ